MRRLALAFAGMILLATTPAGAAVLGSADVTLGDTPVEFSFPGATFDFTYDAAAAAAYNPETYSVQTGGTAETSAFGGFLGIPLEPSSFDQSGITIDGNLFPSYAAFPTSSPIYVSLIPVDLALRYAVGSDFYYGYARLNGDGTADVAFESEANTAIIAGSAITGPFAAAVPELGTWAFMIAGMGLIGCGMRRRSVRRRIRFG